MGERFVPVKFVRTAPKEEAGLTIEIGYQAFKGLLLPYHIELRGVPGEFDLRLGGFALEPGD
jgi:hypothetical protein